MKAVMLSIQPKWCELIASSKKTVEVRKTAPKLETPFKVYIYCTKEKRMLTCFRPGEEWCGHRIEKFTPIHRVCSWSGKVIGEFICSQISTYHYAEMYKPPDWEESLGEQYYITSGELKCSCLSYEELTEYGQGKKLYGLHISNLKIYDKPKPLSEFRSYNCSVKWESGYPIPTHEIKRPPQSWCYVEELK